MASYQLQRWNFQIPDRIESFNDVVISPHPQFRSLRSIECSHNEAQTCHPHLHKATLSGARVSRQLNVLQFTSIISQSIPPPGPLETCPPKFRYILLLGAERVGNCSMLGWTTISKGVGHWEFGTHLYVGGRGVREPKINTD